MPNNRVNQTAGSSVCANRVEVQWPVQVNKSVGLQKIMTKHRKKNPSSKNKRLQKPRILQIYKQPKNTPNEKRVSIPGVIVFLISVASLIVFWPRLSVDPGEMLDSRQPFTASFVIANDGYGFCYPASYSLSIKSLIFKNNINFTGGGISGFGDDIPKLCPNDKSTFSLEKTYVTPTDFIESAEIYINLNYTPSWVPNIFSSFFKNNYRFKVSRKENGAYIWQRFYKDKY